MNSRQRNVVVVALAVAALMALVPPWLYEGEWFLGYHPIFLGQPRRGAGIHFPILALQWAAVGLSAGVVYLLSGGRKA
jgi:hypothetical protein